MHRRTVEAAGYVVGGFSVLAGLIYGAREVPSFIDARTKNLNYIQPAVAKIKHDLGYPTDQQVEQLEYSHPRTSFKIAEYTRNTGDISPCLSPAGETVLLIACNTEINFRIYQQKKRELAQIKAQTGLLDEETAVLNDLAESSKSIGLGVGAALFGAVTAYGARAMRKIL